VDKDKLAQNQPDEETQAAAKPAQVYLEEALEGVDTPEKAEAVIEKLVQDAADQPALEAAEEVPSTEEMPPPIQAGVAAEVVKEAAESASGEVDEAVRAIEAAAAEATALEGPAYEALAERIQEVTNPALKEQPEKLAKQRHYLHEALKRHPSVSLFQTYDTDLFILINNYTPRTAFSDAFFYQLSLWFGGGWAWIIAAALAWPFHRRWAARTLKRITLPIWISGLVVEGPVKKYFRRRRPFIDIVRAVVVGKKPGNWSFPSGHSATAFAGAQMLGRYSPHWRPLWYSIAGLVAFSRIYLGAHYPGDVISGSLFGVGIAEGVRWFIKKITKN
jgi:undecaprenyl-diphosphatase